MRRLGWLWVLLAGAASLIAAPESARIFDRNGVLLAEGQPTKSGETKWGYPLGAFAAQLLTGLDPRVLPPLGGELYLTIDARMQMAAEQVLREVPRGAAVVVDPRSGDVLAMASVPSLDPNEGATERSGDETAPLRNRALTACVPGSTYKIVTALAGMKAGVDAEKFPCQGGVEIGGRLFKCWIYGKGEHGVQDLEGGLKTSCGPFFFQYAQAAGIENLVAVGRLLGVGEPSGLPLSSEEAGILDGPEHLAEVSPQEKWRPGLTANVAIGQGQVLATPLQMAMITAAIANGGTAYLPRLIDRELAADGQARTIAPARICSDLREEAGISTESLEHLRRGMWRVVNEPGGTGRKARLPVVGQSLAGKTGTSQNWRVTSEGERVKDNNALFVGFAPYDQPTLAVCVLVQGGKSGGGVAAPLAARLVNAVENEKLPVARLAPAEGSFQQVDSIDGVESELVGN